MGDPVILVALRLGEHYRNRNWAFTKQWWEDNLGWRVFEGHHDGPGEFNMPMASNRAAEAAGDWEVAMYIGADFILGDPAQARLAVAKARVTRQLTFAHSYLTQLSEDETEDLIVTGELRAAGERHRNTFSGALAVPRGLWDAVGGFDERFVGWGWDDIAFWSSCWAFGGGFQRTAGRMFHLWHPPGANEKGVHYRQSEELGRRYLAAKTNRKAMLEIIAERNL